MAEPALAPDETSAWAHDGAGAAQTTAVPPAYGAPPELAWSAEDPETLMWPQRRRWPLVAGVAAGATALAAAFIIGGVTQRGHQQPPPAATPAPTPSPAAVLEGTYRVDYHTDRSSYRDKNGHPDPPPQTVHDPYSAWWAFRSGCTPAGCTAMGVQLDFVDHSLPHPDSTDTLNFVGGQWHDATPAHHEGDCAVFIIQWSFVPLADGRLQGSETLTTATDECGGKGNVTETPITLTRIGTAPPGAFS